MIRNTFIFPSEMCTLGSLVSNVFLFHLAENKSARRIGKMPINKFAVVYKLSLFRASSKQLSASVRNTNENNKINDTLFLA